MAYRLKALARRFQLDEAAVRAQVLHPVLVWEVRQEPRRAFDDLTEVVLELEGALSGHRAADAAQGPGADALVYGLDGAAKTVGRIAQNDIVLPDKSVSRVHAYLQRQAQSDTWQLVDKGSSNGTWLGPQRLLPNRPEEVPDGALIRFGEIELRFFRAASFFEYLRAVAPDEEDEAGASAEGEDAEDAYEVEEESLAPPAQPPEGVVKQAEAAEKRAEVEQERFDVALSLGELEALLDFYRQAARLFDLVEKTPEGKAAVWKARDRAEHANRVLRKLVVASKLSG